MKESRQLFTNKQLFQLLWPLIVEQLLNVLVGMVDVVMVASLGEAAVSGVSLVDAMNMLLIQFLAALTAGGTVVCSQYIGMKNMKRAREAAGQLIFVTVSGALVIVACFLLSGRMLLGVIFGQIEADVMENAYIYFVITAFSFPFLALYNSGAAIFRSVRNSQISMRISFLMNGMNVVGNAICIFGLHMGVAGVAVPTLISRMTAAIIILLLLQKPTNIIRIQSISEMKPQKDMVKSILGIGIPGGIESSMFQFGKLMLQSLVSTLGTHAIASYAVAGNLVMFLYLPGNSLGLGLTTIVGQCVGAGEAEQARKYTWKLVFTDYAFLAVLATVFGIFRYRFIGIYNLSPEAAYYAGGLVLSHCIAMIIWPLGFVIPHALRAAKDVRFTMIMSVTSIWVFRVGLAYLFVKGFHKNILYVWYAMYTDWAFRVCLILWRFRGFTGRIKNYNKKLADI